MAAQSGLELLGWLRFVESNKIPAREWTNSRSYPATRKISELLRLANVDLAVPPSLSSLLSLNRQWRDGPTVVAGVRNRLVHPSRAHGRVGWSGSVLVEAWILAVRYLEFALLHALGGEERYQGPPRKESMDRIDSKPAVGFSVEAPFEPSGGDPDSPA